MELKMEIGYENILCHGCLSTGRYLSSISQEYSDLFHKLRNYDSYFYKINLQLCWECIAFLNKLKQFKERINTAQSILRKHLHYSNEDIKLKTLSSLKSIQIKTYNKEFNENDNEVNDESDIINDIIYNEEEKEDIMDCDPVDIKTEVECDIKKECSDKELNDKECSHKECSDKECSVKELSDKECSDKKCSDKELSDKECSDIEYSDKEYSNQECSDKISSDNECSDNEHSENDNNDSDADYVPKGLKQKLKPIKMKKKKNQDPKKESSKIRYKMYTTKKKIDRLITEQNVKLSKVSVSLTPTEYEANLKENVFIVTKADKQKMIYKCKNCVKSFKQRRDWMRHVSCFHEKIFPKKCLACKTIITSSEHMNNHWTKVHTKMFKCAVCSELCHNWNFMKKHVYFKHSKIYKCHECVEEFGSFGVFVKHYKTAHSTCICDYCNTTLSKRCLIKHIKLHQIPAHCNICNRDYVSHRYYRHHLASTHPELIKKQEIREKQTNKELSYCVECDKQFVSLTKYKQHLDQSSKHAGIGKVPCPECGKLIHRTHLKAHINFMHLKVTKHYCQQCDKYYAKAAGLKEHITRFHLKVPLPKDKMCDLCGRGFNTNRTLTNHRRTHTGERPFQCKYCPAAFAQQTAMKTHQKTQHEKHMR